MTQTHVSRRLTVFAALLASTVSIAAHGYGPTENDAITGNQYTFAWPLSDEAPKPRGGSTRGIDVTLDHATSPGWRSLREPDIDAQERDRRAILAMAGNYRVSFDFIDVARFGPSPQRIAPYQSWGTETVIVAANQSDFVALQHILVMRIQGDDGAAGEPMVMRHWRQEWRYQPDTLLAYRGNHRWREEPLATKQRQGAWSQTVLQVDDSPRYASVGRWEHDASQSTWISGETLRPLPRREYSVRSDYDALLGTNRHTILPTGWLQEENNLKARLDSDGSTRPDQPYVGREYGVARYERIRGFDFEPGLAYFEASEPFWSVVRDAWAAALVERDGVLQLKGAPDRKSHFMAFFEHAQKLAEGTLRFDHQQANRFARQTLQEVYLAPAVSDAPENPE